MTEKIKPFVVAEGGSGVGKTTAVEGIKKELVDWKFFREPGGTEYGEAVREAVQDGKQKLMMKPAKNLKKLHDISYLSEHPQISITPFPS